MIDYKLITTTCHLYRQSLWPLLPYCVVAALLLFLTSLPAFHQWMIFLWVSLLPVFTAWIVVFDGIYRKKPYTFSETLLHIIDRFPAFMGTLISMLLLPAIIICAAIIVILILEKETGSDLLIRVTQFIFGVLILASLTSKSLAPLLVFTEDLDPNSALDRSNELTQGHRIKVFCYELYGVLFFGLLASLPSWLAISALLTAFLGPWSFALWYGILQSLQPSASS